MTVRIPDELRPLSQFMGCVIFAFGAQQNLGRAFGLTMYQCSELVRVA